MTKIEITSDIGYEAVSRYLNEIGEDGKKTEISRASRRGLLTEIGDQNVCQEMQTVILEWMNNFAQQH